MFIGGEKILSTEGTTQGDPLAMAIYSVAIPPLIRRVKQDGAKQIWFADDATSGGKLDRLLAWWNSLCQYGPMYGYFVNSNKTWLVVQENYYGKAEEIFENTGVNITTEGRRHLGAALGCSAFVESYVSAQVDVWVKEVIRLSNIATT